MNTETKTKNPKIRHHNKTTKKQAKKVQIIPDSNYLSYVDTNTWGKVPYNYEKVKGFAARLVALAQDEEKEFFLMSELYLELGVPSKTADKWIHEFPFFKEAHEQAKVILAHRRYRGAMKRTYDKSVAGGAFGHFSHPELKKQWKEDVQYVESVKKQQVNIAISPEVWHPERQKEEKELLEYALQVKDTQASQADI